MKLRELCSESYRIQSNGNSLNSYFLIIFFSRHFFSHHHFFISSSLFHNIVVSIHSFFITSPLRSTLTQVVLYMCFITLPPGDARVAPSANSLSRLHGQDSSEVIVCGSLYSMLNPLDANNYYDTMINRSTLTILPVPKKHIFKILKRTLQNF